MSGRSLALALATASLRAATAAEAEVPGPSRPDACMLSRRRRADFTHTLPNGGRRPMNVTEAPS